MDTDKFNRYTVKCTSLWREERKKIGFVNGKKSPKGIFLRCLAQILVIYEGIINLTLIYFHLRQFILSINVKVKE